LHLILQPSLLLPSSLSFLITLSSFHTLPIHSFTHSVYQPFLLHSPRVCLLLFLLPPPSLLPSIPSNTRIQQHEHIKWTDTKRER
jgi:hypothetical protein